MCPVIIKISEYNEKMDNGVSCHTNSFYTHKKGYKMCAHVYFASYDDAKGTHLSMFLYVMKGRHDDELTWSLKGTFYIKLLNQLSDSQ